MNFFNFKTVVIFFFFLIVVSCSQSKEKEQYAIISVENLNDSLGDIQLIDVRTKDEFLLGHIPGAINMDYLNDNFSHQIKKLDTLKPVYIYCKMGGRSYKSSQIFIKNNFEQVYDLEGGFKKWKLNQKEIKY